MLGSGRTRAARASATASSPRSHAVCDVIANECVLAAIAEHGDDDVRDRRTGSVLRRCRQLAVGPARQIRRPGRCRAGSAAAIHPP